MRFLQSLLSTALALTPASVAATPYHPEAMQARQVSANDSCTSLAASMTSTNVTILSATLVTAGTNMTPVAGQEVDICYYALGAAAINMCRLIANISTTERSFVSTEVWLPTGNDTDGENIAWNGRFVATGNGGLGGCIAYSDMTYTTSFGFAAVGDNGGHDGFTATQFLNNNDVVLDWVWRARYTATLFGKLVTSTFYNTAASYSYYFGCSTGGRQGLKAIQDHPELFDGVIAGSAANDLNHLVDWSGHFYELTGPNTTDPRFVTYEQWVVVAEEILVQCDTIDGVADGVVEDPWLCHFDPTTLICETGNSTLTNSTSCLTPVQAETVDNIYKPIYIGDELIFPGLSYTAELGAYSWYLDGTTDTPGKYWYRYAVYNDPDFDITTFNASDWEYNDSLDPYHGFVSSYKGDLSAFRDKGGKLITYQGTADGIVGSYNAMRYYEHVSASMNSEPAELDDFYRFFRISGMGHCTGGTGADSFGQSIAAVGSANASNVLLDLMTWVEDGIAPEVMTGTKYENEDPTQAVEYLRNHCRYPYRTTYIGGNPNETTSWDCQWIKDWKSYFPEELVDEGKHHG